MNTFPYIILLKGKLFVIELPEKPVWSEHSYREYETPHTQYLLELDRYNVARSAAIEKAVEVENPEIIKSLLTIMPVTGFLFPLELKEGEEVRWPGTWEKVKYQACTDPGMENLCATTPDDCLNVEAGTCKQLTVARLIAPETEDDPVYEVGKYKGEPSEDLIVAFAKWYSGMDEVKVRTAYKRWLREKGSLNG